MMPIKNWWLQFSESIVNQHANEYWIDSNRIQHLHSFWREPIPSRSKCLFHDTEATPIKEITERRIRWLLISDWSFVSKLERYNGRMAWATQCDFKWLFPLPHFGFFNVTTKIDSDHYITRLSNFSVVWTNLLDQIFIIRLISTSKLSWNAYLCVSKKPFWW